MLEWIQALTQGVVIALVVLQSGPLISRFGKSRLLVAEAFSNIGRDNRMHGSFPSNSAIYVSDNMDVELSENIGANVLGQPPYKVAGVDLSASWIDLVRENKVSASMKLPSTSKNDGENATVEYGIRLVEKATDKADETKWVFEEYVQQLGLESDSTLPSPLISDINATLARSQQRSSGLGVDFKRVGKFVAQLQLVRTLRPPPSEGFQEATTSVPPPYNPETDSFVTGPLRLDLRPLVGRLKLSFNTNDRNAEDEQKNVLETPWDVFHNISPADRRGHFLLLPSIMNKEMNWRGQSLNKDDCHDLVHLANTIEPAGSMFIGYNSVGAGASQNHIHCHSWPYPRIDATNDEAKEESTDSFAYAVNKVDAIYDFCDVNGGKVEVSYLNYPVFCLQMSSSVANLDLLGRTLATCLEAIGEAPHNVGFLNRFCEIYEDEEEYEIGNHSLEEPIEMVDVFLFVRSKERSVILPTLKLGISEMMGIFHAQCEDDLETLTATTTVVNEDDHAHDEDGNDVDAPGYKTVSAMEQALADVSYEDDEELWNSIVAKLETLENGN